MPQWNQLTLWSRKINVLIFHYYGGKQKDFHLPSEDSLELENEKRQINGRKIHANRLTYRAQQLHPSYETQNRGQMVETSISFQLRKRKKRLETCDMCDVVAGNVNIRKNKCTAMFVTLLLYI